MRSMNTIVFWNCKFPSWICIQVVISIFHRKQDRFVTNRKMVEKAHLRRKPIAEFVITQLVCEPHHFELVFQSRWFVEAFDVGSNFSIEIQSRRCEWTVTQCSLRGRSNCNEERSKRSMWRSMSSEWRQSDSIAKPQNTVSIDSNQTSKLSNKKCFSNDLKIEFFFYRNKVLRQST